MFCYVVQTGLEYTILKAGFKLTEIFLSHPPGCRYAAQCPVKEAFLNAHV